MNMRQKIVSLSIMLLMGLGLSGLQAQVTISSSGGNATGTYISWAKDATYYGRPIRAF